MTSVYSARFAMAAPSRRVLLAHSYFLAHDPKQVRKMRPYPPLATLIAASVLRARGYEVGLFDAMLASGEEEFEAALDAFGPSVVGLLEDNFNFLSKMCTMRSREASLAMVRAARGRGCRVGVNGSDSADHPELYLAAGADAVVLGETEATFPALVDGWTRALSFDARLVPGLALLDEGQVRKTPPRPFVEDLDRLPLPAWDLVDVERYRRAWTEAHGRLSWNVVTTRGCPFKCNWCAKPLYGTRYAQRSPASVAAELAALEREVGPEHVWFADDIFGLTPRWIESFADEVERRGVRIPFTMQSRVDLMTPSSVAALARAGAEEVWMGVESGAQSILDAMDKGTTVSQVRTATHLLDDAGIRPAWFLQLGYLGEDWPEILATRDLVREERPCDIGVSVSYPLPGTGFHERVKGQLGTQTNWSDSDDLAMMFEGTFRGELYRRVRDLLHEEALASLAREELRTARRRRLDAEWHALEAELPAYRTALPSRARSLAS